MKRLLINTANEKLFIVLQVEDKVFAVSNSTQVHHNEVMLPLIDKLLKEHKLDIKDIEEFGVVVGPGSFTGIRIGISTIKAFRDALGVKAKGINNLDYLFALANKKQQTEIVAILGSKDSYFVAKKIHDKVYKYEHNLTKKELKKISNGQPVAMFKIDETLPCFEVVDDAKVLLDCFVSSTDEKLVPVYYQLSQAENEKLKRGKLTIKKATLKDLNEVLSIEQSAILTNQLTELDIKNSLTNHSYVTLKAVFNNQIVGYIILQATDELNIVSVAVKKEFRNLGIGTKLLKRAEFYVKKLNLSMLSLEVSLNNITAYLVYQKFGFKQRRIRKNYYADGADCLEMIKQIN